MHLKLVFKNLRNFATGTPMAFLVVVLLEIFSAIVIVLSYGIVRNVFTEQEQETFYSKYYKVEKYDEETGYYFWEDSNEFLENFDKLLNMFGGNIETAGVFGIIELDDTEYTCGFTYYADEEAFSANEDSYYYSDYTQGKRVVTVCRDSYQTSEGSSIKIGGEDYLVVKTGSNNQLVNTFLFSYNALPINMSFNEFIILFKKIPTHEEIDKLNEAVHDLFGYDFMIREPEIPDLLIKQFNSAALGICTAITLIVVFNCIIVYMYVLQKRSSWLAVVKLCGCNNSECAAIFIAEIMLVTMLCYAVGAVVTKGLIIPRLEPYYPAFKEVYTSQSYLLLFAGYAAVSLLILDVNVTRYVSGTIDSMRKEAI